MADVLNSFFGLALSFVSILCALLPVHKAWRMDPWVGGLTAALVAVWLGVDGWLFLRCLVFFPVGLTLGTAVAVERVFTNWFVTNFELFNHK